MPDYYRRTKNKVSQNGDCCIVFGESQGFLLGIFKNRSNTAYFWLHFNKTVLFFTKCSKTTIIALFFKNQNSHWEVKQQRWLQ